jgi:hypothetical protein
VANKHGVFMKKILLTLSLAFIANLSQAAITFNEIILKKDMKNTNGIHFTVNASVASWCGKYGNALDVGTFKVAQQLEALEDGLYKCSGEFARLPGDPFRAFKIDNCAALDAGELRLECTKP